MKSKKLAAPHWAMTTKGRRELSPDKPIRMTSERTWIHVTTAAEPELTNLLRQYKIHPLTVEDMLHPQSRIKMEKFPHYVFFTFRGLHYENYRIFSKNFHFIVLGNLLITVTTEFRNTIFDLIRDWNTQKRLLEQGPEFVIHHILDIETDHTLAIVRKMEVSVDEFERYVLDKGSNVDTHFVFEMRGNLHHIKRVIGHHKEILESLDELKNRIYSAESHAFFRDVHDHQIRILETVDNLIASITLALEVHLTISSRRTNEIMKTLTILTSILLPMTFVTGIFGMNFQFLPWLQDPRGHVWSFVLMGILGAGMFLFFRWRRWF